MSKITRNIDTSDRLMLRTSQLKECQAELQSLRAWKEKARPFLIAMEAQVLKSIEDGWIEGMEDDEHEEHERYLTLGCNHDTLTELLKEG